MYLPSAENAAAAGHEGAPRSTRSGAGSRPNTTSSKSDVRDTFQRKSDFGVAAFAGSPPPVTKSCPSGDQAMNLAQPGCCSLAREEKSGRSHTKMSPAQFVAPSSFPPGEKATPSDKPFDFVSTRSKEPVDGSDNRTVPSQPVEASQRPRGSYEMEATRFSCTFAENDWPPPLTGRLWIWPSPSPQAMFVPSGENAAAQTGDPRIARKYRRYPPVSMFQTRTPSSSPADTRRPVSRSTSRENTRLALPRSTPFMVRVATSHMIMGRAVAIFTGSPMPAANVVPSTENASDATPSGWGRSTRLAFRFMSQSATAPSLAAVAIMLVALDQTTACTLPPCSPSSVDGPP